MPRKKRRGDISGILPVKPGIARTYVTENFPQLPQSSEELLNGHILCVYMTHGFNIVTTEKIIKQQYTNTSVNYGVIQRVVRSSLERYKVLNDQKTLDQFKCVCNEITAGPSLCTPRKRHADAKSDTTSPSVCSKKQSKENNVHVSAENIPVTPSKNVFKIGSAPAQTTPLKTRQISKCKQCRLKNIQVKSCNKTIDDMKQKCAQIRKQYRQKPSTKAQNQSIKRKQDTILRLKSQIALHNIDCTAHTQLSAMTGKNINYRKKYFNLKRNHDRLKNKNKTSMVTLKVTEVEKLDEKIVTLEAKLSENNEIITDVENKLLNLEDQCKNTSTDDDNYRTAKIDGKQYSYDVRMMVYDSLMAQVPTHNICTLLKQLSKRLDHELSAVPHRNTVEQWARELGVMAELQAAEAIMSNEHVTIGFDATTQEGCHINAIHITTEDKCLAVSVHELAGGTAQDYCDHISSSIDNLAHVYSTLHKCNYDETRTKMISHITNCLSDRCAANHAAISLLNTAWNKTLRELYCHLHPLDSIASGCRSKLKSIELHQFDNAKTTIYGGETFGHAIILQMCKMRYKDGKGDPSGFKVFLDDNNLPRGLLPRYRGNRLHIMFQLAGIYFHLHDKFVTFLSSGPPCGGLRSSILTDIQTPLAQVELQVVGLLGALLTSPWLKLFYASAASSVKHIDGISIVRGVRERVEQQTQDPCGTLTATKDFFGNTLEASPRLHALQHTSPVDRDMFSLMMKECLQAVVDVITRQYKKYFDYYFGDIITDTLKEETNSARLHNIDSEELMGMFSALKSKAPNATIDYLSCKMRARKNRTNEYLDAMDVNTRNTIIKRSIKLGRHEREKKVIQQKGLIREHSRRRVEKERAREDAGRRKLERTLKNKSADEIILMYPEMNEVKQNSVRHIVDGTILGKQISHVWIEEGKNTMYAGKLEKRRKNLTYIVKYWMPPNESYAVADKYDMTTSELLLDLINDDLSLSL